jgi:sugar phosphate isomerase/epimerase
VIRRDRHFTPRLAAPLFISRAFCYFRVSIRLVRFRGFVPAHEVPIMDTPRKDLSTLTRRDFGKLALAAVPASMLARRVSLAARMRIDSRIKGVQIGAITYSFNRLGGTADDIIKAYVTLGLGEMELMSNHAEALAGAPTPARGGGAGRRGAPLTPEEQAAQTAARNAAAKTLADWRAAATEATFQPAKKKIQDAGIDLRLLCYNINSTATDETIEYGFKMAKWLGVKTMTTSTQVSMGKRIAPFADKYNMIVGFHGHDSVEKPDEVHNEASFMAIIGQNRHFYANLDVGHYTAAGGDAVAFIKAHHDRITNLHFKDMHKPPTKGYTPFGEGDAPLKDVLLLMAKEKWDIPVNIEFEYQGEPMTEIPKCFQYIKQALA